MSKRLKTDYPGIFYRLSRRIGGPGRERVYYAIYKVDGKITEAKLGRQYQNDRTPAKAAHGRSWGDCGARSVATARAAGVRVLTGSREKQAGALPRATIS